MVNIKVRCPTCNTDDISKNGHTKIEKQRYCCNNEDCEKKSFLLDYTYNACNDDVKEKVVAAAMLSFLDSNPDTRSKMFDRLDSFLRGKKRS